MTFRNPLSRMTLGAGLLQPMRIAIPLALVATMTLTAGAQLAGKGAINGRVVDSTGAAIPDATVTIKDNGTNKEQTLKSSGSGDYSFSLDPGKYTLSVKHDGFKSVTQENVNVNALQTFSVDLTLPTGETSESVTVTDTPPTLETSNATLGVTIEQEQYSALPLIQDGGGQRRATDFASLLPGVSAQTTNGNQTTNAGVVNGGGSRGAVSAIYINGVPITSVAGEGDPRFVWTSMAVDAIEQFQVQTVGYSAIYEGQGVQNYVVKRGTNQIHGAMYDYFRDTALDTYGFTKATNPLTGNVQKPTEHQHEYGLFAGFPIIKNKLFFFGGYEGYQFSRQVPYGYMTIPTLRMRQGDFGELLSSSSACATTPSSGCIYDPDSTTYNGTKYSRTWFTGNVIPTARLSPVAQRLQSYLPNPTNSAISNNYLMNYKTGLHNWTTTNRVDWTINDKQAFSAVLAWGRQATTGPAAVSLSSSTNGMPPPYISSQQFAPKTKVFLFEHTYAINSHFTNQLKYGFGRYDGPGFNQDISDQWGAAANGISGLPAGQAQSSFPTVTFTGNTNINRWAGYSSNRPVANGYVLVDNLQWVKGSHTVTFGYQIAWMQYNYLNNTTGVNPLQLTFNSSATAGYTTNTTAVSTTGQAYASYMMGAVNNGTFTQSAVPETGGRFRPQSPYFQDNWKVNSKLTLDYGLRWDFFPAYSEVKNRFAYFDPNATNPLIGAKGAVAFGGYGAGLCNCSNPVNNYFKNLSPRIGFAFQTDPKTVFRGSWSVIYTHGNANGGSATSRQGSGLQGYSVSPTTSFVNPTQGVTGSSYWKFDNPYPSYTPPPNLDSSIGTSYTTLNSSASQTPTYADPYYGGRAPQFINWNFGMQRELSPSMTLTISYVGSQGHFLQPDSLNARGLYSNQLDPKYLTLGTLLSSPATGTNGAANRAAAGITSLPFASFGGSQNPTIAQALKPFAQYGSISDAYGFVGNTRFHALQVYITKRLTNGLTFMTNYQWARNIDNNGNFRSGYDIPASVAADGKFHAARSLDKSLSLGDQRHKFVVTGAYDLPFGRGQMGGMNAFTRAAFGGFKLSGIFQAYSGAPLSITMNSCNTNPSQNVCYPFLNTNYTGNGKLAGRPRTQSDLGQTQYLDPNAFQPTSASQNYMFSTSARTAPLSGLFQPPNYKLDMSLRRAINIPTGGLHEGTQLVLEADYFNVTNHTHFVYSQSNAVISTFGTSSYGTMQVDTNAPTNRALQLAARLQF